jgi:hypothetical protein
MRNQPATGGGDLHLTDPRVGFEHGRRGSNFGTGGDLSTEEGRGTWLRRRESREAGIGVGEGGEGFIV